MTHTIHTYPSAEATAKAVAELLFVSAKANHALSKPLNVALSGGSTPKLLFSILATEYKELMPWSTLRLFWVDERCVPPAHEESNFGMTYNSLLKEVMIAEINIFRMQGEEDPSSEAVRYQELLVSELPSSDGFPQFDIILLGMGDDGHTASIFPNDMSLLTSANAVAVGIHPSTGQQRITLTGPTICQALQVVFLVTGANKAKLLSQIFAKDPISQVYPAAHVHSIDGVAEFYIDQSASDSLDR
jgi:6-phosphogluconolactonase